MYQRFHKREKMGSIPGGIGIDRESLTTLTPLHSTVTVLHGISSTELDIRRSLPGFSLSSPISSPTGFIIFFARHRTMNTE